MRRIAVIGGGIAGLAAAALAAHRGHEVELFEAAATFGGRARSWRAAGFTFDTGPSWFLMREAYARFFAALGRRLEDELQLTPLTPAYRVHRRSERQPVDVFSDRGRLRELWEQRAAGSSKQLDPYLDSATELYRLAMREVLYRPGVPWRLLAPGIAGPRLLAQAFGSLHESTARRFPDALQRALLRYPAVFLGTDPRRAPALYHLLSHLDLVEGVLAPAGGFSAVVDRLQAIAAESGVRLHANAPVRGIETSGGRAVALHVEDGWHGDGTGGQRRAAPARRPFDAVISAVEAAHTVGLLDRAPARRRLARRRAPRPGMSAVLALLGVRGELPQLAHHNFFFTDDWDAAMDRVFRGGALQDAAGETPLYVCRPTASDPTLAPPGHENLFVLVPVRADPAIGAGGLHGTGAAAVERTADLAIEQIARWSGAEGLAQRVTLRRTIGPEDFRADYHSPAGALLGAEHSLGRSALFRRPPPHPRLDNLHFAGGSVAPGVGVPLALISAQLAVEELERREEREHRA